MKDSKKRKQTASANWIPKHRVQPSEKPQVSQKVRKAEPNELRHLNQRGGKDHELRLDQKK